MSDKKIKEIVEKCISDTQCEVAVRYNEHMKDHTTFKVGGKADCWLCPDGEGYTSFCVNLLTRCEEENIPVFILGSGANIVVSDKGIRGIVLDMGGWTGESVWSLFAQDGDFILKSGTTIDEAVDTAAAASLTGLEFLAGMPGTIGGAVWMNARCYDKEMADVLKWVEVIHKKNQNEYTIEKIEIKPDMGFGYKKSPFQEMDCIIISAAFHLKKGEKEKILLEMDKNREDRYEKGHYEFPCAGSIFKNNRDFGKSTGEIIDGLGLKGAQIGGAKVAPFHGNIIINTGKACAKDIRALTDDIALKVKEKTGFILEPEILFVGDWS